MSSSPLVSSDGLPAGGLRAARPLVVAGFVISFVLVGGGIDTVSVFLDAIARATDWSRSALSLAVSIGALSAALTTPIVGVAVDRFGVRVPMTVGVGLLAIGFGVVIVMSRAWHFAAANVLLGAGFAASALLPITVAVTMRVSDRTALALGIVGAGASAGAFVLAPVVQAVIAAVGWRGAYVVMGTAVVLTPLPFLVFSLPRGRLRGTALSTERPTHASLACELRRPGVAPLAAVMILPALAGFSVSVHLVPYLTSLGHAGSAAAGALGATIGISAFGKIGGGFIADRIGPLPTLRLSLMLWALALAVLHHAATPAALGVFVLAYGLAFGTQMAVIPPIAVSVLGSERFGTLFGLLQLAAMLASAIGPIASGVIFDATGRYSGAVLMWLGSMTLAVAIAWAMRTADAKPAPVAEGAT